MTCTEMLGSNVAQGNGCLAVASRIYSAGARDIELYRLGQYLQAEFLHRIHTCIYYALDTTRIISCARKAWEFFLRQKRTRNIGGSGSQTVERGRCGLDNLSASEKMLIKAWPDDNNLKSVTSLVNAVNLNIRALNFRPFLLLFFSHPVVSSTRDLI